MTLSNHFNHKAKTEGDFKIGVRKKTDGSTVHVRAGKILSRIWADGSRDTDGAEVKQSKLKQQAVAEKERLREQARAAKAPSPRAP